MVTLDWEHREWITVNEWSWQAISNLHSKIIQSPSLWGFFKLQYKYSIISILRSVMVLHQKKTFTRCLWLMAVSVFAHRPSQPFVLSIFMKNISCQENKHSLKWLWTRSGMGTASEWENRRLARLFLTAFLAEVGGGARIKINSRLQLLTGLPLWVRRHSLPSILELLFSISPWPPSRHSSIPAVPRPPPPLVPVDSRMSECVSRSWGPQG